MLQKNSIRVAISQSAPVYHNKQASLTKALELIQQAAGKGAQLVVFGETWFPGYPVWLDVCPTAALWNHEPTKRVFAELKQNSISITGPEVKALADPRRRDRDDGGGEALIEEHRKQREDGGALARRGVGGGQLVIREIGYRSGIIHRLAGP